MKFLFTLCIFLLSAQCLACNTDSVENYYLNKNKAEIFLVDSSYAEGLVYYKKAFSFKSPDFLDLYNALVMAYRLKDTAASKAYFDRLAFHGLNKEKFERVKLGLLAKDDPFYKEISKDYDSLYKAGSRTSMFTYAKIMDSLSAVDQAVRKFKAFNPTEEEKNVLLHADSTNLLFLQHYIADHGFPSYDQVGTFEESLEGWSHSTTGLWFLLWHTRHTSTLLNKALLE
ncbi:MAG: hypothetical protein EOP48_03820, partial [Sphingobacteriales bacterium]